MKLAVMMAAYNAAPYIGDALGSILAQRQAAELDVIVVNDGSTDDTAALLAEMVARHPQIRVIETPNQGVTRARNVALAALAPDTDLVTFLDADDLVAKARYARDVALFAASPALDLVYGTTQMFREAGPDRLAPALDAATAKVRTIQLAAGMYRYGFVAELGPFDIKFKQAEDMDFLLRMFERAPNYQVLDDICLHYRRHDSNMTHDGAQLRRDFSRALLMSIKRRRQTGLPGFPPGLFDSKDFAAGHIW